ncbi:hypothetical protein CXF95_24645 [Paraglaciecola sp. MB-3u-78]|nr:hypothetical protein CXF95_24645 [Paraglaciecola sp. MB-3u-78]
MRREYLIFRSGNNGRFTTTQSCSNMKMISGQSMITIDDLFILNAWPVSLKNSRNLLKYLFFNSYSLVVGILYANVISGIIKSIDNTYSSLF